MPTDSNGGGGDAKLYDENVRRIERLFEREYAVAAVSCSFGNSKIKASAVFSDESEMAQKLVGFADSLHFGSINAFGHWLCGSGALKREKERCAVI